MVAHAPRCEHITGVSAVVDDFQLGRDPFLHGHRCGVGVSSILRDRGGVRSIQEPCCANGSIHQGSKKEIKRKY